MFSSSATKRLHQRYDLEAIQAWHDGGNPVAVVAVVLTMVGDSEWHLGLLGHHQSAPHDASHPLQTQPPIALCQSGEGYDISTDVSGHHLEACQ